MSAEPGSDHARRGAPASAGVYIHTPFCETKCGYCDFYSVALKGRQTAPLVDAVLGELESRLPAQAHPVRTIFVGGGTPTLLPLDDLQRLLLRIGELVSMPLIEEFTVEANPATVDEAKAELLAGAGVSRVSMGAQSFLPAELAALERLHSPDDIAPSVDILRCAGIRQINIDLIFGIPGQTLETWSQSLSRAIALGPDHIACYGLTYEPNTRLTAQRLAGRISPCDEDLEADMFMLTIDTLAAAGYRQYEISNYARPGLECQHNLIYWRNEPYIGVGPSAAGCYEHASPADRQTVAPGLRRYKNWPDVGRYTQMIRANGHAETESEIVVGGTLINEIILMQMRLNEGLCIESFESRTGRDPVALFGPTLSRLADQGLLTVTGKAIALTGQGRLLANHVIAELAAALP